MSKAERAATRKHDPSEVYSMTSEELQHLHKETCEKLLEVLKAKSADYSGGGDVLSNFRTSVTYDVHPVIGVLLRCQDKFMRIKSFTKSGKLAVEGEGVLDAIDDVINYMVLIKALIIEEEIRRG